MLTLARPLSRAAAGSPGRHKFREGVEPEIWLVHTKQGVPTDHYHPRREEFHDGETGLPGASLFHLSSLSSLAILPYSPPMLSCMCCVLSHSSLSFSLASSFSPLALVLALVLSCSLERASTKMCASSVYPWSVLEVLTWCLRCLDVSRRRATASTCTATKCRSRGVCSRDKNMYHRR